MRADLELTHVPKLVATSFVLCKISLLCQYVGTHLIKDWVQEMEQELQCALHIDKCDKIVCKGSCNGSYSKWERGDIMHIGMVPMMKIMTMITKEVI